MPLFDDEQPQRRPIPTPEQQRLRQQRDDYQRRQQYAPPEQPVAPRLIPQQPQQQIPQQYEHGPQYDQGYDPQQGSPQQYPQNQHPQWQDWRPPKPKFSLLKWIPWILLGFLFLGGSIGGVVWSLWPDHDHDRDDYRPSSSNPAEYFIENYSAGLAELSRDVAGKIDSGELEDLGAVRDYWNPRKEKISGKSFGEMGQALDSVNGDRWDRGRAVELFELFEEGFRR